MGDLTERAAEEQLYAERERYRTLIGQVEIGIFHSDADDRLLFVNDEYLRTMGCSAAELAGTGWHSRVHPDDRERVMQRAVSAGSAHRNWSDQYRVMPAPGEVRWVRASARPLHDQDGVFTGYLGTCLDITELREAEEDRRRAAVAQAARDVSDAAAARLQALVTGLSAIVWERDARSGDYTFITDRVVDVLGYSINAWIGRSDFWAFTLHPADREEAVAAAAAATAAGQDWEQTYRAVGADGRTVWLHDLVHVVRDDTGAAASVLGVSIDVTTQKRQDEAIALLAEFGFRQDADQALAERLDALVRAATPLLGELSAVGLVGPDNLLRPFVAAAPAHPDAVATLLGFAPLPLPPSLAERLAAGRAFVLPGTGGEILSEVVADEDELRVRLAVGARDWLVVPLMAAGRLLGLLAFAYFTRPRGYDRLDLTLAEEFGHRIALMIRTDEAAGRERHLRDVSAALASADTPAAVGRVLRTGLAYAFGASGLTIHALGPDTHLLRLVTAAGYPAEVTQRLRVVRLSDRSPIAECARTGEPVWPRDSGDGPTWPDDQVDGDDAVVARVAVALPLRTGGRLVGVVATGFPTRRAFDTDERDSIAAMISQAAQAFHRAVDAEQRRDIAETLQHSLLPAEPPHLERLALATRYLPGVSGVAAGGDWFDVITLDENRTAIVVGDVVGQGAAAAALMGQLRSALSSGLLLVESPAAAIAHLNRFTARIPGARASTAVCLVIDTAAGQARWARAGHPPPLLVPREGAARHVEGGAGPLLGVFSVDGPSAGVFTEGVLTITPGDTLVLYTDGLVERRGESIDDGMDRLAAAASSLNAVDPQRLVAGLLAATVPTGRGHDDIAVVAARFLPPPLHGRCPARPAELSGVRRAAREWMTAHGVTDTVSEDLQLALGESAANAVEHAYGPDEQGEFAFTLSRRVDGTAIDVEVTDFGRWRPPSAHPGFRGRGLDLVRALAQSLSVERSPAGTTVRFTMAVPEARVVPNVRGDAERAEGVNLTAGTPEAAMFEEAQLYAPVTRSGEGDVTVHLSDNHPGAVDPDYRARRNALAALAMEWQPGTPPPVATYTEAEHDVWRTVCGELHGLHERLACAVYLEGKQRLGLPESRIPQLSEVNALLRPLTGFRYVPAAGLVPLLDFYGSLADGIFHSTQYVRHHSVPLYTPEPDVLHEVFGHGNCLAHDRFARLYRLAGEAARRVQSTEALEFVSKVFWFSLEFGVVRERGEVRCYGAGLLSSYGEIQQVARADLQPLDIARMGVQDYDITHYQPVLFCAEGFSQVEDVVGGFFAAVDDDQVERLTWAEAPDSQLARIGRTRAVSESGSAV